MPGRLSLTSPGRCLTACFMTEYATLCFNSISSSHRITNTARVLSFIHETASTANGRMAGCHLLFVCSEHLSDTREHIRLAGGDTRAFETEELSTTSSLFMMDAICKELKSQVSRLHVFSFAPCTLNEWLRWRDAACFQIPSETRAQFSYVRRGLGL